MLRMPPNIKSVITSNLPQELKKKKNTVRYLFLCVTHIALVYSRF